MIVLTEILDRILSSMTYLLRNSFAGPAQPLVPRPAPFRSFMCGVWKSQPSERGRVPLNKFVQTTPILRSGIFNIFAHKSKKHQGICSADPASTTSANGLESEKKGLSLDLQDCHLDQHPPKQPSLFGRVLESISALGILTGSASLPFYVAGFWTSWGLFGDCLLTP